MSHKRRRGFSLLEVMVALAIFLLGLVGIGQLITMGGDRALEVTQQSQAIRLCQSKMAEVASGVVSLTSQPDAPFDEDPDWNWSIDAEQQGDGANLWTVKITVTPANTNGPKVQASLTQIVFDPAQRGSTLDITAAATAVAAAQAQADSKATTNTPTQPTQPNTKSTTPAPPTNPTPTPPTPPTQPTKTQPKSSPTK